VLNEVGPGDRGMSGPTLLEGTTVDLGIVRRLSRLATDDGFFDIAALDHPENYLALLDPDITRVSYETVVESKLELGAELARHASGLLLDPVYALGQAIATRTLPRDVGLVAPIEVLTYRPDAPPGWDTATRLRPKWTPEKMAKLGVDGVKLILFYRADLADTAAEQRKLVADLAAECRAWQLPLIVEPIWYPLPGEEPAVNQRADAIVASAAEFTLLGVDVLKMQYPGSAAACRDLDAAATVPWVLLSEGAGFDDFAVQMQVAAGAGASGYIAGRAVWGDAVGRTGALAAVGERLETLNAVVRAHGRPWAERASAAAITPTWYESYGE
jgi:tagatose-1,6-bisphosphate aldolase